MLPLLSPVAGFQSLAIERRWPSFGAFTAQTLLRTPAPCHPRYQAERSAGARSRIRVGASPRRSGLIAEERVLVENHDRLHLDEVLRLEQRGDTNQSARADERRDTEFRAGSGTALLH